MLEAIRGLGTSFSFRTLLDKLIESGASNEKIEKFLDADIRGQGSIRDVMTARMTNELAHTMGQPTDMNPQKVKEIREWEKRQAPLKPGEPDPFKR